MKQKKKLFKYQLIHDALAAKIAAGLLEKLPSEEELGKEFSAGRNIVRQALQMLVDEGYIKQYYELPQQKKALEAWTIGAEKSMMRGLPTITPKSEELSEYANIMNEVDKYRDQMIIKFITGIEPLDKFDEYVETMNKYGLERAMEIQTAALKRYEKR